MLQTGKSSLQYELDDFFGSVSTNYTKSAFSQYRKKLRSDFFNYLNKSQLSYFYDNASSIKRWKGFRLLAVDGSTIKLPCSEDIVNHFGVFKTPSKTNRKAILGRISQSYDVLNKVSVDVKIASYKTSEQSLLEQHLSYTQSNDLILLDRAYNVFWLVSLMMKQKHHFVIRMKANQNKRAKQFLNSTLKTEHIELEASSISIGKCNKRGLSIMPIRLRMVRVPMKNEEDYVLFTNLPDSKYSLSDIKELYKKRWAVEESFKIIKQRAELENLSGKTVQAVEQDFYRTIFKVNLSSIISKEVTYRGIKQVNKRCKNNYQVNYSQSLRKITFVINTLFYHQQLLIKTLAKFSEELLKQLEICRPNRTEIRLRRFAQRPVSFMTYKP